ncbi:MAG: hypothetical protein A2358_02875 [Candidatus Staskawiczbacteria bacterium RIFOXYB1_FULL_37_44]|uniref:Uncharacterized protein n=1 Tax=Candidatus Staskawiczbacteria bacterium RIFOXYB1_FULL_37_44 TaxID=1802223 RepID=A0A1G2IWL3_9BACT|nr:MAG: hypothetical protein A2358_02875 [Candidatus Staskawiczbacteria bacterium RIFOXYB1_FULL_37_44]OGZ83868.1 MAG: hypothetical protein A2416_02590 [Candidatus Staskawiczbacteria bacterium RIFOXYC1_FULL_37_52]OGZ89375.1 MAG: hypothetical protein A2581_00650 [Candidatus Staskawiczbacteria bacterium RIFOXYD1_FULL_37_110]
MRINKLLFIFFILFVSIPITTFAANLDNVNYPIAALGNCDFKQACHDYCNKEENHLACIEFAKNKEIYSDEKADRMANMEKFKRGMESAFEDTPGGCVSPRECDAYCRIEEHLDECLNYSVKIGHATQEEADKIREKANKGGPGGCKSKETCKGYCTMPEHFDECANFLVEDGKLSAEDAKFAAEAMREAEEFKNQKPAEVNQKKAAEILKIGSGPGGCVNVEECSKFCSGPEHMDECLAFAQKNNLIAPENLEKAKKLMAAGGPGGCRGQTECKAYCNQEEHSQECMDFSLKNGTMTQGQYDKMNKLRNMMEKTSQPQAARPGGCKTDEECNKYCTDSSRIEECIDYALGGGRLNGEIIKNMMGKSESARQKFEEMRQELEKFNQSEGGQMPPAGGVGGQGEKYQVPPNTARPPVQGEGNYGPPEGYGPPPGNYGPPPGYNGQMPPPEVIQKMIQGGQMPPEDFRPGEQSSPGYQPGQQPPPPSSFIINKDSLVGSLIDAAFKFFTKR